MPELREHIELTPQAVEKGYKNARAKSKRFFKSQLWMANNLPGQQRRAVNTLLSHLVQCIDFLDLESTNRLPLEVWSEIREDVSDAFLGKCTTPDLAALADACITFKVPKQFLFDPLEAADTWIRNRGFETWEELKTFSCRFGGSFVCGLVPVLGYVKPDYEIPALRCGQAILLTQLLASCVTNFKQNKNFFAVEDLEDCEVELHRVKMRQPSKTFTFLVRLYCSRIEKMFYEGGQLINYLDYDGIRTMKSLLAYHWKMLVKMRAEPELVLADESVLTNRELLGLRSKHLLGMEGNIPILPDQDHDHH